MLRVGLTGGIGSGKSAVARRLVEHGAVLVDADAIAREVVAPGTPGLAAVLAEFGEAVRAPDGGLDRARLAEVVFADQDALRRLNAIVHPLVLARRTELVAAVPPDAVVVEDVPLLVENHLAGGYDLVLVVQAPAADRVQWLLDRGMTEQDVRARMAAQASDAERREVADVVLVNDGSLAELAERVDAVWEGRIMPLARARDAAGERAARPGPAGHRNRPGGNQPGWVTSN